MAIVISLVLTKSLWMSILRFSAILAKPMLMASALFATLRLPRLLMSLPMIFCVCEEVIVCLVVCVVSPIVRYSAVPPRKLKRLISILRFIEEVSVCDFPGLLDS